MYICNYCGCKFEEPERKITTFESHFGVSNLFPTSTRLELLVCPNCDNEDMEELRACDICGEFYKEDDLQDTEGAINGGVGYACPQCIEDCDIEFI